MMSMEDAIKKSVSLILVDDNDGLIREQGDSNGDRHGKMV